MIIENNNKTSKGSEGWELQNFRTVELFQLSSTAQNETQDFYEAFCSRPAIWGYKADEKYCTIE